MSRPALVDYVLMPLLTANSEKLKNKIVMDIGTGSGILALYAAQLGAAKVIATDIAPEAIACAQSNSRRFGLDKIIETRLVTMEDTTAFAPLGPIEVVDVIVSLPSNETDRTPFVSSGAVIDAIRPNDTIKLGLSIIDGLGKHLKSDGVALLLYDSVVEHNLMVGYARHKGYLVEHHQAMEIHGSDWCALYNTFAAKVARSEGVDPDALLLSRQTCDESSEHYVNTDWEHAAFPPLWGKAGGQIFPGMIVITRPKPEAKR